jgi:phosphatidylglycerophosphate synthase
VPRVDRKHDPSFMAKLGHVVGRRLVPLLPGWVTPNQVTIAGCCCMLAAGLAFYLASFNRLWLLAGVLGVVLQWVADHLDGDLARLRGLGSERGFFLDLYLDMVGIVGLFYGLALASYTSFLFIVTYLTLVLLRGLLLVHWIMLRYRFEIPMFGLSDAPLLVTPLAALTWLHPGPVVTLGSLGLGWWDLASIPLSIHLVFSLVTSFAGLVRELDSAKR